MTRGLDPDLLRRHGADGVQRKTCDPAEPGPDEALNPQRVLASLQPDVAVPAAGILTAADARDRLHLIPDLPVQSLRTPLTRSSKPPYWIAIRAPVA